MPYTPSQNGMAERLNRTLITKVRAMLVAAELPRAIEGRPQRSRRIPQRYENTVTLKVNYSPTEESVTLTSYEEAICRKESRK
jgi:hypothetical protein